SVMARPGGVFCTHFDLQNLSYTNTGGVCGVAPITSLYALRRRRKFPAICGDSGAQKSFSDVRGSNRAGGVISSLRGVTRRFTRGLRGAFRPSFFLLRTVFRGG
ncbi:hypothetical protein CS043_RS27760, partial [Escherichia coli]